MRLWPPEGEGYQATLPAYRYVVAGFGTTMTEANHNLTATTPDEALDLYLRERSTEVADSTLQAHEYRLNHFVRWCNEKAEIENLNNLTGRDLHRYKLWRQEDGDLNKVSLKSQMDTLRVFVRFCETFDAVPTDLHSKIISPTLSDGTGQRDVKLESDEAEALLDYLGRFEYASFSHVLVVVLQSVHRVHELLNPLRLEIVIRPTKVWDVFYDMLILIVTQNPISYLNLIPNLYMIPSARNES